MSTAHCTTETEAWRPIPGVRCDFQVSDRGRVRSRRGDSWRFKKLTPGRRGYLRTQVMMNSGKWVPFAVHRLVAFAFHGVPGSDDLEVRHLDGNPGNNAASNLAWGTWRDNHEDKARHGRVPRGETNGSSVLTDDDVRRIVAMRGSGETVAAVASSVGITGAVVSDIMNGRLWSHVTGRTPKGRRKHINPTIKPEQAVEMVQLWAWGMQQCDIANQYGVGHCAVNCVVTGRCWSEVTGLKPLRHSHSRC